MITEADLQASLRAENAELRARLDEAEETLRAISSGEVDALVVGEQVYLLTSAEAASNQLRGRALAQVSDAVITVDNASRVTWLNAAAEQLYGVSATAALGQLLQELFACRWPGPDDEAAMFESLRENGQWRGENIHVIQNGAELSVESVASVLRDEGGAATGLLYVIRDITRRKEAEAAILTKDELLTRISAATPTLLTRCSRDLRYLYANRATADFLGFAPEKIIGKPIREVLGEDAFATILPYIERVLQGERVEFTRVITYPAAGPRFVHVVYVPEYDSRQNVAGWMATITDLTERRQAEDALRESEARLRIATEAASMFTWECDLTGGTIRWSENAATVIGCLPEELPGDSQGGLFFAAPDEAQRIQDEYESSAAQRFEAFALEFRGRGEESSARYYLAHVRIFYDDKGAPLRLVGVTQDITDRKRTEERYRGLFTSIQEGLLIAELIDEGSDRGPDFRYIDMNPAAEQIIGMKHKQVIGRTAREIIPDVREDLLQMYARVARTGEPLRHEIFEPMLNQYHENLAFRPAQGQVAVLFWDITERRLAEQALRESEEKFHMLADNISQLVWTCDELGNATWYNQRWYDYTGSSWEQMRGDGWKSVHHPEHLERVIAGLDRSLVAGAEWEDTFPLRGRDGQYRWFLSRALPIRDAAGKIVRWFGTNTDITEREQLLAREQQARETAEAATRAKDEFLAVVSHELRNPLNAILGYTRLARLEARDAEAVINHCEIIEHNARAQQQLIEDLLDTARIISGKLRLEIAPTDLRLVLQESLEVVRPTAEARQIELLAHFERASLAINCDAGRLRQVILNLLQNAIKFTPAGGRVELRAKRHQEQVRLIVSDTGRGISAEFLPYVFDRFSQSDMSHARRYGGLGLGLSLVRQLVELHGGTIEAASEGEGCGATFTVTLPLSQQQSNPSRPALSAVAEAALRAESAVFCDNLPSLEGLCILVADDQKEARHLIVTALREHGARVIAVSSGLEVLAILSAPVPEVKPDLLLLDISMPAEDGYNVLKRVRALETERGIEWGQRIPAIALTAHTRTQDRLAALAAGFQMHVGKPVEISELIIVIDSVIKRRAR